ncbi:acyl-CoA dehydrogenase [Bacillus lacus]|uniref:Acyl-CoA dehydrogenase n=1 Tax=Metabacillus lacus TaxID=1983721 RepID=A0A7X2IYZ6_9BACI|nr:acyl-CoA dehydrogenase family protein [Metabacillus lacus]MRX72234.1 acyl-CoA dehydrogenase [Metabacillus lacus]
MEKTHSLGLSFLLGRTLEQAVFTPEDMTDEHRMIASSAKQFLEKEVDPCSQELEEGNFAKVAELMKKAGSLGLLAHSVPEKYGGLGLDKISKGIVGEVIGRSSGYGVAHSNHTCIATLPITYFGSAWQKEYYLPKLASGEFLGAYCLTEPGAGSDALASSTSALLNSEGTHYVLNGTKIYITNAVFADTFIVYAKVDGIKFSAFIVEKSFPGLSLGPEENKMGIKGSSTRSVILEDCLVPIENLLGEEGKGHIIAFNVLNLGRYNLGSACMGASKHALQMAIAFIQERKQFGRPLANFPSVKEKVAKMAADIYAAESLQYRTAGLLEEALGSLTDTEDHKLIGLRLMEFAGECSVCKVFGSETLDDAADEVLQLYGGAGYIKEYGVEKLYRDSRINRIFEGTNEINRLLMPGLLFKKAAKGELNLQTYIKEATEKLRAGGLEGIDFLRQLFLSLAGQVYLEYGEQVLEEQESIMKLSDLAITLYAAESAVLRTRKAKAKNGSEGEQLKEMLTKAFLERAILKSELIAKALLNSLPQNSERKELMICINENFLQHYMKENVAVMREIADTLYQKGSYVC